MGAPPLSRAVPRAGRSRAARMVMIAIIIRSSTRVKLPAEPADRRRRLSGTVDESMAILLVVHPGIVVYKIIADFCVKIKT